MTGKADAVRAVSQQFKDRTNAVIEGVMAHLRDDNAREILGPGLSPLIDRGSLKSIVTFALYADVLRMVRDMVMADGEISDEEVQESLGLLSVLAGGFAKVRKEYAAFAELSHKTARKLLSLYESDDGLFGYSNESTKWAGVNACRNIAATSGDPGPLDTFGRALVLWAESLASSDGMSPTEVQHLDAIRNLCTRATAANEERLLTTDVALKYVSDPDSLDLSSYTVLEDGAAAELAKTTGLLDLSGVTVLSVEAAKALSRHAGELHLEAITLASAEALSSLSKHRGPIFLTGLANVTEVQARVLAGFLSSVELPTDGLAPEVMKLLSEHPSTRIRDDYELADWLLEKLDFNDSVDSGRSWVSDDVMSALLDICVCWQSDAEDGDSMRGSELANILKAVRDAGRREIHVVRLNDPNNSVFMFVGSLDEVKQQLVPVISIPCKKKPAPEEVEESDDDKNESDWGSEDDDPDGDAGGGAGRVATVRVVQDFLKQFESGDWDFLSSYDSLDSEAAAMLAADFPWGDDNELWLGGIRDLPSEVAGVLATPLPQDEAEDKVPILVLSGLEELQENTAKALSKRKWSLQLPKLKRLDSGAATYLGKIPRLVIGVEELSGPVATKLAAAKELAVFVPRLSVDAAIGLSAAAGMLLVDVKEKLSDKALRALQDCRGTLFIQGDGAPS